MKIFTKMFFTITSVVYPLFLFQEVCLSNNSSIQNISYVDVGGSALFISFDLSWENSWHYTVQSPGNHDACWIFGKYLGTDGKWHHIKISGAKPHRSANIQIVPDRNGVFINAKLIDGAEFFEGNVSFQNIRLKWKYSAMEVPPEQPFSLKIFAIEMAYITGGSFYVGVDSVNSANGFFNDPDSLGAEGYSSDSYVDLKNPFPKSLITTPNASATGGFPQYDTSLQYQPAFGDYPNGFNSIYCMKYEISQKQYVDFLNCLISSGTDSLRYSNPTLDFNHSCNRIKRYGIYLNDSTAKYETTHPNVPMNYLSWLDGIAYADWAALRPMSELEYEKICRGPADVYEPISFDYDFSYGTGAPASIKYILDLYSIYDTILNFNIEANNLYYRSTYSLLEYCDDHDGVDQIGQLQVGTFANMATHSGGLLTRNNTGSTYYGVMEMSGNLVERCVGINERWCTEDTDSDLSTPEYDWPTENTPSCSVSGISFKIITVSGIEKFYKDCPSQFKGGHGDGELDEFGDANVPDWPTVIVDNVPGAILRGGRWNQIKARCYVADRLTLTGATARTHESQMRFVRTQ